MRRLHVVSPLALLLGLSACGTDGGSGPQSAFERGDLPALFAPPTADERRVVLDEWSSLDLSPTAVRTEAEGRALLGVDSVEIRILSHLVDGNRHYGAVIIPVSVTEPVPALVYAHFSDIGVSVESALFALSTVAGLRASQFALVVPAFRGLTISYDNRSYTSQGIVSPWEGEVDDALALLNVAWEQPRVASGRAATIGFSGGATIGLLMAIREPGIEGVVDFFGTVDFFGPFVENLFVDILDNEPPDLPKVPDLQAQVVVPLQRGQLSLDQMRLELLRRSAAHFAERLPPVLAHHGLADDVVPDAETRRLVEAIESVGGEVEDYYYPGGGHSPFGLSGSLGRTAGFLSRLSGIGKPAAAGRQPAGLVVGSATVSRSSWFSAAGSSDSQPAKGWPPPMQ